jgi:hypothetical protein
MDTALVGSRFGVEQSVVVVAKCCLQKVTVCVDLR